MTTPTPQTELEGFIIVSPIGRMFINTIACSQDNAWRRLNELRYILPCAAKEDGYTCQPVKIVRTKL